MAEVGEPDINTSNKELLFELLNSVSYIVQNKYTLTHTNLYIDKIAHIFDNHCQPVNHRKSFSNLWSSF